MRSCDPRAGGGALGHVGEADRRLHRHRRQGACGLCLACDALVALSLPCFAKAKLRAWCPLCAHGATPWDRRCCYCFSARTAFGLCSLLGCCFLLCLLSRAQKQIGKLTRDGVWTYYRTLSTWVRGLADGPCAAPSAPRSLTCTHSCRTATGSHLAQSACSPRKRPFQAFGTCCADLQTSALRWSSRAKSSCTCACPACRLPPGTRPRCGSLSSGCLLGADRIALLPAPVAVFLLLCCPCRM